MQIDILPCPTKLCSGILGKRVEKDGEIILILSIRTDIKDIERAVFTCAVCGKKYYIDLSAKEIK